MLVPVNEQHRGVGGVRLHLEPLGEAIEPGHPERSLGHSVEEDQMVVVTRPVDLPQQDARPLHHVRATLPVRDPEVKTPLRVRHPLPLRPLGRKQPGTLLVVEAIPVPELLLPQQERHPPPEPRRLRPEDRPRHQRLRLAAAHVGGTPAAGVVHRKLEGLQHLRRLQRPGVVLGPRQGNHVIRNRLVDRRIQVGRGRGVTDQKKSLDGRCHGSPRRLPCCALFT